MNNMFCFQCEQTAGGSGCTGCAGVCGKQAAASQLQDELTGALIGLARSCEQMEDTSAIPAILQEGLFATITNVNFDDDSLQKMIDEIHEIKNHALKGCEICTAPCGRFFDFSMEEIWTADEDIRSLKSLILFGLRGMAAYAYHARILGYTDEKADRRNRSKYLYPRRNAACPRLSEAEKISSFKGKFRYCMAESAEGICVSSGSGFIHHQLLNAAKRQLHGQSIYLGLRALSRYCPYRRKPRLQRCN